MRILFLCSDNSIRSQMAEGLARSLLEPSVSVASAGLTAGKVHPMAVNALREAGVDITTHKPKTITELQAESSLPFDLVIVTAERDLSKGLFPGSIKRMHWPVMDPLDPPAIEGELRRRFRELVQILSGHIKPLVETTKGRKSEAKAAS